MTGTLLLRTWATVNGTILPPLLAVVSVVSTKMVLCLEKKIVVVASNPRVHNFVFGARDKSHNAGNAIQIERQSNVYLDDIRIYDRSITADEVSVLSGSFVNKIVGYFGNDFSHQILATKGPEQFEVSGGSLPPGLSVDNTGKISGKPTKTGDFEARSKHPILPVLTARSTSSRIRQGLQNLTFDQDFGNQKYGDSEFALVPPPVLDHQLPTTARTRTFLRLQKRSC